MDYISLGTLSNRTSDPIELFWIVYLADFPGSHIVDVEAEQSIMLKKMCLWCHWKATKVEEQACLLEINLIPKMSFF